METGWLSDVGGWASAWPEGLWRASWQGALCAALVWALARAWPRMPASLRAGLWWLVALKFVVSLGWMPAVPLPLLPAPLAARVELALKGDGRVASREQGAPGLAVTERGEASRGQGSSGLAVTGQTSAPVASLAPVEQVRVTDAAAPRAELESVPRPVPWLHVVTLVLLVAWLAGVVWQVRGHVKGWASMRRLRQRARPLEHPVLESEVRTLSSVAGLRRVPALLVSDSVVSPLATGLLSPVVVLPAKAVRRLPVEALRMALAHELAHLRRGDLWLGWVPALAEALLFFHPLARRAAREYALAREEACDAEALRLTGAEPADYGELLLAFGVTRAHGTAAAHGASAHIHALHRRLSMLEHVEAVPARPRRLLKVALSALGLAALVPFQVVAQEAAEKSGTPAPASAPKPAAEASKAPAPASAPKPAAEASKASEADTRPGRVASVPPAPPTPRVASVPPAPPAPRVASIPPAPPAPRVASVPPAPPVPAAPRVGPVPPVPPSPPIPRGALAAVPAAPPVPPAPPRPPRGHLHDDESGYVLLSDGMATMNGSTVDLELARMFQKKGKELLYVRRKGEAFIIRDANTLKAIRAALEPVREMGKAQGDLGEKQGALGEKQGALGQRQGELGMKQGALGMKQAELAHKQAGLHLEEMRLDSLPEAERDRRRAELRKQELALEQEMKPLEQQMQALGEQMEVLGREQEKLGEQQEVLGREQEKLGEQHQARVEETEKKVQGLIDEALKKGLGEPLPT
ncbi:M56 family metallopeptidase [Pyxidicoccus xibeiensis]|uniref:M56 family metallopeptidase n=1 Tax=Pyxidicoccus xibeiensis TaxID=2906759 RepID=UPI0020A718A6|nr:M56 family metallopeptidase [Pyxidicoccus xibeiensis]MCP3139632.1 peptidase M56 [Pyxidicoccus xibeiensis]